MKYKAVLIVVEDVNKSRNLYENCFGQKVLADYGEDIAFEGFSIHQKKHFETLVHKKVSQESNSCELYFEDDDLEGIENIVTENKLEYVHKTIEQPWKQKAVRFYDFDKNLIEVGETFEHIAYRLFTEKYETKEILKYTFFTEEQFEKIIQKYGSMS